jgi:hypothetical protein
VPTRPSWAKPPTHEERAAQLLTEERATTRDIRRAFFSAALGCLCSTVAGLALMGWALHTTDRDLGSIAFLGGLIAGYAGITVTLARLYLRGERSGWW